MSQLRLWLIWICLCAAQGLILAQPSPVRIPRVSRPPKLSDFLNNVPREGELVISDFRQYSPGDGEPVSLPTTAYLSYDDNNLYVAYVCKDDPNLVRARLSKRDQLGRDDRVTVNLDTWHDHRRLYWFDFNALGIQSDGNATDGVEDTTDWDTVWYTDGRVTEDGYVVLATIPFRSLRFPKTHTQNWGLILGRFIQRNNETATWPHLSRTRRGWTAQGGDLEGLENISAGRNIQLIPYGLFSASRFLDQPPQAAPQFRSSYEKRAGLDSKVILRDSFTLDLALNPDFSQVESDEPQVTVNQRYEVFFPEKRPFFLDNAGFFKTPQQLFFSRRIADPEFGARLTGKAGRWGLGLLAMDDRAPGQMTPENDPMHGRRSVNGVFRLQREFFRDSSLGALVTSQDFGSMSNRVLSLDTSLKVARNWTIAGQAMTSDTRGPGNLKLSGPAYYAALLHEGRHFISETSYTDRSPNFRSQLGFINRVDMRQAQHTVGYLWRPERSRLVSFGPQLWMTLNRDRTGRWQEWMIHPSFGIELKGRTELSFGQNESYEWFGGRGFRKRHTEVEAGTEWLKWLGVSADYSRGTDIVYYPASGFPPFLASMREGSLTLTIRPNSRWRLDETYIHSGLTTRTDARFHASLSPASVFNNHIVRSKVNYQFTRELSLRAILDYNAVLPNAALVNLDRQKHLGADILLSYMLNYGTALHVGYTDLYDNVALDPMVSPNLRRTAFPDTSTGRQFFVKLSYLFRM